MYFSKFDNRWSKEDIEVVKKLEEAIAVQQELLEHAKRIILKIASKYDMTEHERVIHEGRS